MRAALSFLAAACVMAAPAAAQERSVVEASAPDDVAVTIYRDPQRSPSDTIDTRFPQGFGVISETRTVTLPPGRSTIRFAGVAEGMVAVSAIVTGLPGGTIEKNRNADLLSPAALVDGTLGNQVTITRTNPATGVEESEQAIVRTRADGGLVLETDAGFEAVRCSGLPERLTFRSVPDGLSAQPIYTVDTFSEAGGTHTITLSYIASGFDWQAHYVGTLSDTDETMQLTSWLTVLNTNGQSFRDAELLVVAGTLNVMSDFRRMAQPPQARALRLTCYPLGSTAAGSPVPNYNGPYPPPPPPPPPAPAMMESASPVVVTGSRRKSDDEMAVAITASEEDLGDLKLYRVPIPVTVAAQGIKQVAFLQEEGVKADLLYRAECLPYAPWNGDAELYEFDEAELLFVTRNDEPSGLGQALPMGGFTLFEPTSLGTQLVAELNLRDYASGQDVELEMGYSAQVRVSCGYRGDEPPGDSGSRWSRMRGEIVNANPHAIRVRMIVAEPGYNDFDIRWRGQDVRLKNGQRVVELIVPANATQRIDWRVRPKDGEQPQ